MPKSYWLTKSEPSTYGWDKLVEERRTVWDGIRNPEARNNLRAMKKGDLVLFYHSGDGKEIVGLAKVAKEAYPDPSAEGEDWSVVELSAVKPLRKAVGLAAIKADSELSKMVLVRRSRLSVVPVTEAEFERILELAGTSV